VLSRLKSGLGYLAMINPAEINGRLTMRLRTLQVLVGDRKLMQFSDCCLVLNMIIDQTFENDVVFLCSQELSEEWKKIHPPMLK